jgi:hemerythrin
MKNIEWNESYSVGVKIFDEQHQQLLSYLNKIRELFNDETKKEEINDLLTELEQYAIIHFKTEEDLFTKYKYYNLEKHNSEHRYYEQKVSEFRTKFQAADGKIKTEILEFLADWLMGHIQGTDKEYRYFMNNNGVF